MSWNWSLVAPPFLCRGQPPCEAVSWNCSRSLLRVVGNVSLLVRLWVEIKDNGSYSLTGGKSASLWGCELKFVQYWGKSYRSVSASLWGCELKYIQCWMCCMVGMTSASLWGCELKFWNRGYTISEKFVSLLVRLWVEMYLKWRNDDEEKVSLLVRLWVEISCSPNLSVSNLSASLWGCELKYTVCTVGVLLRLSASLWGCELKYITILLPISD